MKNLLKNFLEDQKKNNENLSKDLKDFNKQLLQNFLEQQKKENEALSKEIKETNERLFGNINNSLIKLNSLIEKLPSLLANSFQKEPENKNK